MEVNGVALRPLRALPDGQGIEVIDQRLLPHRLQMRPLHTPRDVFVAIREMWVRGAPLIGAVAAYGLALQARRDAGDEALRNAAQFLEGSRPTAVNLAWAVDRLLATLLATPLPQRAEAAWVGADAPPRPSTRRTPPASRCTCGSTRRGRATRAPA